MRAPSERFCKVCVSTKLCIDDARRRIRVALITIAFPPQIRAHRRVAMAHMSLDDDEFRMTNCRDER
jgi:hypothetical protein